MAREDLGPAERLAAGAIGTPGKRTFYLEVTASGQTHTFVCEKGQVADLAQQGLQLLTTAGLQPDQEAVNRLLEIGLEIVAPTQERFRIGSIGIGITANEFLTMNLGSVDEEETVSFVVTPEQFQAMAIAALGVVAAGRPLCPRCGLPEDPDGHFCPSVNGHHPPSS